jgi:hypothetical protein
MKPFPTPQLRGQKGPAWPESGAPTQARKSKITGELYWGCTNYPGGCRFKGDRSHCPLYPLTRLQQRNGGHRGAIHEMLHPPIAWPFSSPGLGGISREQ